MSNESKIQPTDSNFTPSGKAVRDHILDVAIKHFANNSYEAATSRAIAQDAGVNIAMLYYYFKDKRNLFLCASEHAADLLKGSIQPELEKYRQWRQAQSRNPKTAKAILMGIIDVLLREVCFHSTAPDLVQFLVREQQTADEAFDILYIRVFKETHDAVANLVSNILDMSPDSLRVRILSHAIIHQAISFLTHKATFVRSAGLREIGEEQTCQIVETLQQWTTCALDAYNGSAINRSRDSSEKE